MKDKELNKIMIDENAIKASKKEEWAEMMKNEVLD